MVTPTLCRTSIILEKKGCLFLVMKNKTSAKDLTVKRESVVLVSMDWSHLPKSCISSKIPNWRHVTKTPGSKHNCLHSTGWRTGGLCEEAAGDPPLSPPPQHTETTHSTWRGPPDPIETYWTGAHQHVLVSGVAPPLVNFNQRPLVWFHPKSVTHGWNNAHK